MTFFIMTGFYNCKFTVSFSYFKSNNLPMFVRYYFLFSTFYFDFYFMTFKLAILYFAFNSSYCFFSALTKCFPTIFTLPACYPHLHLI
ncbi:hypothetical protein BTU51_0971 [Rickettsia rickettsii]|uniref:Uncharacterized protein n=1 Tax=Rickettsia rickettsii (strain Iowa) TaxID=452659 RepID=B0BY65_RICRO|nr:hypothetical protein RrIowa_0971 [Rickettsia rickettsii str. Iowa]APU55741.1 hypothetical protein BTU50_0971 [Rickettsia rickettsii]APU57118.1 hypothetical protein BTU51_0971 [Rickettsia rickettsii]